MRDTKMKQGQGYRIVLMECPKCKLPFTRSGSIPETWFKHPSCDCHGVLGCYKWFGTDVGIRLKEDPS